MSVVVLPDFLDSDSCFVLINALLRRAAQGWIGRRADNRVEIPSDQLTENERATLYIARDAILRVIGERFCPDEEVYPEFVMLQSNYPGDRHAIHADNARLVGGHWGPNHTPQRAFSAGLYLNTCGIDYTGGELVFPDRGVTVSPEGGMLAAFPSDYQHVHEVLPIKTGVRHSVLVWFTKDKAHARYV